MNILPPSSSEAFRLEVFGGGGPQVLEHIGGPDVLQNWMAVSYTPEQFGEAVGELGPMDEPTTRETQRRMIAGLAAAKVAVSVWRPNEGGPSTLLNITMLHNDGTDTGTAIVDSYTAPEEQGHGFASLAFAAITPHARPAGFTRMNAYENPRGQRNLAANALAERYGVNMLSQQRRVGAPKR